MPAGNNPRNYIVVASILLAAGIVSGALGAHALRELLPARNLESFKTGTHYLVLMALYVLALNSVKNQISNRWFIWVNRLAIWGVLLFSGSIFILSTLPLHHVILVRLLGPITPLGGFIMISSCILLAFGYLGQGLRTPDNRQ